LHVIVVVGATASICTTADCTASALPATSVEKNLTVVVLEIVNAPV
jgi:hypothetical protein